MPVPWRESAFTRKSYNPDKGFDFKEGSPRETPKIEDVNLLRKGKSDRNLNNNKAQE